MCESAERNHNGLIKVTDRHHKHFINSDCAETGGSRQLYQCSFEMTFNVTAPGLFVVYEYSVCVCVCVCVCLCVCGLP